MGRDSVRAVCRHCIYIEDDMLSTTVDFKTDLENKLLFTDDFMAPVFVEAENASVRFLSYNNTFLFGIVSAAADMDATMLVLDTHTDRPADTGRFQLAQFTYFLINVNAGMMVSMYKRNTPKAARVIARCFNNALVPKVYILDELSDTWKQRLASMKSAEVTAVLSDMDTVRQGLAQARGLEGFVKEADRVSVTARWESPGELIPTIERADRSLYDTLKVRGLNPSGRYDVIDFLQDEISLKTEIELTDAELRAGGWEAVRDKLIGVMRE